MSVFIHYLLLLFTVNDLPKGQNPLRQFPRNKCVTSWRGQKSVVSVVSCRFPNSITTTCCNKVTTSPSVTGKRLMDFGRNPG